MKCNQQSIYLPYSYRHQIQQEILKSLPPNILAQTQSAKVVRTAAGMLRLNLLECSLLAWLLKRSKYGLVDLLDSSHGISLFEEDQNKQLLLLILLNAYYVKTYLNQNHSPELDSEISSLIPQFSKTYRTWRPDIQLRNQVLLEVNESFNNWMLPQRKVRPDYNQLVNKILELSKTYNVNANEEQPPTKKRKPNEEPQKSVQQKNANQEYYEPVDRMMLRSSKRMLRSKISNPSEPNYDIFEINDNANKDFLRRSSNNIRLSGFMNFSNIRQTNNMLSSRYNINNSIVDSRIVGSEEKKPSKPKIKITQSFDRY